MKSSLFPDVNVWLALTHDRHAQHVIAARWLEMQRDETVFFCRFTQLGLLRLLTNEQLMGVDVMSQRRAWQAYQHWFEDGRVEFHREPEAAGFDALFEKLSASSHASPKVWADAYLAAFAKTAGLTLVTFDKAFQSMATIDAQILSTSAG